MTVACVLRSGGIYTAEWVDRLWAQVRTHGAELGPFVALSDVAVPCARIHLRHDWPGWWSKMELFRPGVFPDGELVLYLDLDTLVVGDIHPLCDYPGEFATLTDFMTPGIAASGVMLWRAGAVDLYAQMLRDPPALHDRRTARRRSDHWWNRHATPERLQDLFPRMFGSYKVDGLVDGPGGFSVVCFHGRPKMHEAGGWAAEAWTGIRTTVTPWYGFFPR